jgi:hypothetical protein
MTSRWGRNTVRGLMALFLLFDTGAIYYSTIQPAIVLEIITIAYAASVAYAIFLMPFGRGMAVAGIISLSVFAWYLHDPAQNHRDWALEYAVPATVSIDGQTVKITNIRDFTYSSPTDATPQYYNADFRLDQLSSADLVSSYWAGDTIAHIFLSFGFKDGRHLAISIETRRQKRFPYSTIAGFFHHYELFYVVADERDLIGVRTDVRHEQVYLYRLQLSQQSREALFLSYMRKVQDLSEHPQWYNTLSDNCTTGILSRAQAPGRTRLNWRVILSGHVPEYAYQRGLLDSSVSFATLRQHSLIVRPEGAKITDSYSQDIRKGLPYYPAPAP